MTYSNAQPPFIPVHSLRHELHRLHPIGAVLDGGMYRASEFAPRTGPFIETAYHPDDGYHAALVDTDTFNPLYLRGVYLIFITGTLRDAVANRPALVRTINGGGRFGFVEQVTRDAVLFKSPRIGQSPPPAIRRDEVEMVFVPMGKMDAAWIAK